MTQILKTPHAPFTRRNVLQALTVLGGWPLRNLPRVEAADRKVRLSDHPFQLGIASGEPSHDGVVLWTRLAPAPLDGGGMPPEDVRVDWRVAEDDGMKKVVRSGTETAAADWAHSVHVEVEGLRPDRTYWYQFRVNSDVSPIGRTRTAPRPDSLPDRMRFAFASCQHYESGYYTAYEHMAQEDLHAVIHLGDYIYEGRPIANRPRLHAGPKLRTLDDFRTRHAQYKTDAHLQAAHAAFPWIVTWDDHEVENNYANEISQYFPDVDPVEFLEMRAHAYKAYYEHMPLRRATIPVGPLMQLYRSLSYGRLANFNVLDTRQYRTDQPCGDGRKAPCEDVYDPVATILGAQQEQWLNRELKNSQARWNVMAQQVMIARVDHGQADKTQYAMDKWAGYHANRNRLLGYIAEQGIANTIVLTGDIHSNWVADLKVDYDDPDSQTVGTEFVGTSISSGGDGRKKPSDLENILSKNPAVHLYDVQRGYVQCELTPDRWTTDYRIVEQVSRPGAPLVDLARFVVENGRPGVQRA